MAEDRKTCSVYLYIPNIIGYVRILLALLSFYYMPTDYVRAGILYTTSCLLDAFDGYAARYFNQVSLFGAVLDLLTDRVIAPVGLLVTLSILYPTYSLLFQLFLVLDISSHWLHLHSSILTGKQSHKTLDKDANALMKFYYSNRIFLFSMAAGNELFFSFSLPTLFYSRTAQ
ncbi:hypothetical protein EB796_006350 [Bugula neritina]|uniref:CDP-diacylglycerol--inositol 3-phosphatidyltransferase n=1 Tax=Bugula neritina TaxID=10212 RepID=A0A7J7KAW9_BUGNE|nr:hypothetical protein EB796_006350 [Bugula neritina]